MKEKKLTYFLSASATATRPLTPSSGSNCDAPSSLSFSVSCMWFLCFSYFILCFSSVTSTFVSLLCKWFQLKNYPLFHVLHERMVTNFWIYNYEHSLILWIIGYCLSLWFFMYVYICVSVCVHIFLSIGYYDPRSTIFHSPPDLAWTLTHTHNINMIQISKFWNQNDQPCLSLLYSSKWNSVVSKRLRFSFPILS